jgi:hypothetical protein
MIHDINFILVWYYTSVNVVQFIEIKCISLQDLYVIDTLNSFQLLLSFHGNECRSNVVR